MGIEQLFSSARRGVQLLGLAGVLSCIPLGPPPYQPKPMSDYERYPAWRREIAFHEIKKILDENCHEREPVTETSFTCKSSECVYYGSSLGTGKPCEVVQTSISLPWSEVRWVQAYDKYLWINRNPGPGKVDIMTQTPEQAVALEKAMRIYVGIK